MQKENLYKSCNLDEFDTKISNKLLDSHIFWARIVSSESESLLTKYTKHTFYEVQYALEGKIKMLIGQNDLVILNKSDFIIIPPDTYHQIVDADSVGARFIMAFSFSAKDKRNNNIKQSLSIPTVQKESRHMRPLLTTLLSKKQCDSPMDKRIKSLLFECILIEILETACGSAKTGCLFSDTISLNKQRIDEITLYIKERSGVGIHVSDISEKFNISERHLNRIFNEVTGKSLKETINYEKLKKIEELTSSTKLSLCEISALCGFCDEYSMNKFFRRYNKINLSEFRKLSDRKK